MDSISKLVPYTIIPIAISSVRQYTSIPIGNTFIWWGIYLVIMVILFWSAISGFLNPYDKKELRVIKLYLFWNIISIFYGLFMAESYWHYKMLVSMGLTLLLPIIAYIGTNKAHAQSILSVFIRFSLPLAILLFPLLDKGSWGWYLYPVTLLMLFFPVLPLRAKYLIAILTIIPILADFNARSHVIKYSIPILLLLFFYYTRIYSFSGKLLEITRKIVIVAPFIFFGLAVSGIFQIFKMDEYIDEDLTTTEQNSDGEVVEKDLKFDSRTFIYQEVLTSALKYNYWFLGRSPARGNETEWFKGEMIETYGTPERPSNEVGILNVFTWTGVIGVVLIFLVFYRASYLAINLSNNLFSKLIGLFVAFHWAYSWVEEYQLLDTNNFVIWLMVGLCFSNSFRRMNNAEVKLWVHGIFNRNYSVEKMRIVQNYYIKLKTIVGNEK